MPNAPYSHRWAKLIIARNYLDCLDKKVTMKKIDIPEG